MDVTVKVLYNRTAWGPLRDPGRYTHDYIEGDELDPVWEVSLPVEGNLRDGWNFKAVLDDVFRTLNIAHPYGWRDRSMCVGDVVVIGEVAWACAPVGWILVALPPAKVDA